MTQVSAVQIRPLKRSFIFHKHEIANLNYVFLYIAVHVKSSADILLHADASCVWSVCTVAQQYGVTCF